MKSSKPQTIDQTTSDRMNKTYRHEQHKYLNGLKNVLNYEM